MIRGLRTVIYHVTDLHKAKAWYSAVLGKEPYFDQPFYVGYNVGGYELGLDPAEKPVITGTNVVAYWAVDNAQEAYQFLLSKGGVTDEEVSDVGGGILVGTVKDPFGNIFGIIENSHFKIEE
jgi:predicted enzyme related to lactoylglutathione lyase